MELIAASRIVKAQQRAQAAGPYARELTRAVSAVATFSNVDHPLTTEKPNPNRAAVLLITSDRGQAGAYSSIVIREGERLNQLLREDEKEIVPFLSAAARASPTTPSGSARSRSRGAATPTRRRSPGPGRSPTR